MAQAQRLYARDFPDLQHNKMMTSEGMKGVSDLDRSQRLTGPMCSSKQPCRVDRVVQQAVLQILEPIFEPTFHPSSHGFRPHRGAHTAIAQAKEHLRPDIRWWWILICRNFSTGSIINACSTGLPNGSPIGGCWPWCDGC